MMKLKSFVIIMVIMTTLLVETSMGQTGACVNGRCAPGLCCSRFGFCGTGPRYCGGGAEQQVLGLKPNHITFIAILQACTHAGFLDKGMECFDLMTKLYKLSPLLEHYSCIVDLLGRKGKFKEALEFIESMPFDADAAIWGALLGACKIHQNIEIGEYAGYKLYQLEPQAAVSYVEMANMYASAGKWDGVSKVRAQMKCNKVNKFPGQSLIQVDGKNHIFGVEERCHSEVSRVYQVLDVLAFHMKKDTASHLFEDLPVHDVKLQDGLIAR